jgi:DNA-binding MarR family transcriptional regulator
MLTDLILTSIPLAVRTLRRSCASSLGGEITFQQFRVLSQVYEGMGQTQISQNLQVSVAAVSKLVDLLVKRELVKRDPGEDRRSHRLTLTREGEKLRRKVHDAVARELQRNVKKLSKQELSDLKRGLSVLDKLMGYVNEQ